MRITCWGSRGSIPVSGKDFIRYGGDTTCIEIRTQSDDIIIIDAGTGIRRLGNQLIAEQRDTFHLIFTHAHWDHVMGFPFFKPVYTEGTRIQMIRCPFSRYIRTMLSKVMDHPSFPVKYSQIEADIIYEETCRMEDGPFEIGSVTVTPIRLSHPNTGSGFRFTENGKSFVFLTDNELGFVHPGGLGFDDYVEFCSDADILFHDGEYTPAEYKMFTTWGHSAYTQTLALALKAGVRKLGLFHLNQDRRDWQMDEIVADCNRIIAESGSNLRCFGVRADATFML